MTGGLGNIYDALPDEPGARGPDMRVDVQVPRAALGSESGFAAPVPTQMEIDGVVVARRVGPGESDGRVSLHLPADFQDGAVLRLRGQGGEVQGGRPGDLLVGVHIVESATAIRWPWVLVIAIAAAAGAWLSFAP